MVVLASTVPVVLQGCWENPGSDIDLHSVAMRSAVLILLALATLFLVLLIAAPFVLSGEGQWFGRRFVYREPKLIFHGMFGPSDNAKVKSIKFPDAPPFSWLEFEVKFETDEEFQLTPLVVSASSEGLMALPALALLPHRPKTGGVTMNRGRWLYVSALTQPTRAPSAVSIYAKSWTV
jgi:hypothetical protein